MRHHLRLHDHWPNGQSFTTPPAQATLEQGRSIYEQRYLDCKGPEGRDDGTRAISLSPWPNNLVSAPTSAKSDQELLKIIANGRPRTAMPALSRDLVDVTAPCFDIGKDGTLAFDIVGQANHGI